MTVDAGLASDPLPEEVSSWLAGNEWRRITRTTGRAALGTRGTEELLQPTLRDASDYDLRYADMLRRLSVSEQKSAEALAQEMIQEGSDVTEWRAVGAPPRQGGCLARSPGCLRTAVR